MTSETSGVPSDELTAADVLADLVSNDPSHVIAGAHAVIRAPWPLVGELAPHADRIELSARALDLGGALHSNANHVAQAVLLIRTAGAGGCACKAYHGWMFYDPRELAAAGRVEILGTSEPAWDMTYECRCTRCGALRHVEQGNHHYTWWKWSAPGAPGPPPRG